MIYVIIIISSVIAGSGIGGGSIFIMLATLFNILSQRQAQLYNLIMFVAVGIFATFSNIKDKVFDKKLFFKMLILIILGSFIGTFIAKYIDEKSLKLYFNIFILLIGIYETIYSIYKLKKSNTDKK
ncbi:MAG: sulfite exporter TauE/SafE family protein [Clostridia bacterium]